MPSAPSAVPGVMQGWWEKIIVKAVTPGEPVSRASFAVAEHLLGRGRREFSPR